MAGNLSAIRAFLKQQFQKGDVVHIAADLGTSMAHFTKDVDAIVVGSYYDQYGTGETALYTVHIPGKGRVSWYQEGQLELIERGRLDLLEQQEAEYEASLVAQRNSPEARSYFQWQLNGGPRC